MPRPTPDFDYIYAVWIGTQSNGVAAKGTVTVEYDGDGPMLDPSSDVPVAVHPIAETKQITPAQVNINDKNAVPRQTNVGIAIFEIPVSNDPDIEGGGGTYKCTVSLTGGAKGSRTFHFYADKDAGTITVPTLGTVQGVWLNEIAGTSPDPGTVYSALTIESFTALDARVAALEAGGVGGDGTVTSVQNVLPDPGGNVLLTRADFEGELDQVDNTSDADKPLSTAATAALAGKADLVGGLVPTAQLPPQALGVDTYVVASQAAMLALSAIRGDVAVRTDENKTYRLSTNSPSTLVDWIEIPAAGAVTSVAGKTGTVVLAKGDVGLGAVDNTADSAKPVSTAQAAALAGKADTGHTHTIGSLSGSLATAQLGSGVEVVVDFVKSGGVHGAANAWPASRPGADIVVMRGPKAEFDAGRPTWFLANDVREYVG